MTWVITRAALTSITQSSRGVPPIRVVACRSSSRMAEALSPDDTIVQYICVLRNKELKWPTGAFVAQGAHAAVAAVWESRDDADTQAYVHPDNIDRMHKIIVEASNSADLSAAEAAMKAAGVGCRLWIEQPENFATALASKPAKRSVLKPFFAGFKLMR